MTTVVGALYDTNGGMLVLDTAARSRVRGLDLTFLMTDRFASAAFRLRFLSEIETLKLTDRRSSPKSAG